MTKFMVVLALSLFSQLGFSVEDALIAQEELAALRGAGRPIQIGMIWRRLDGKFETIADFYLKADSNPITKRELAENCKVKILLPFLANAEPLSPLKVTIIARPISEEGGSLSSESVTSFSIMDKDHLYYYGFIEAGGK
jgi:hypothetical protein